MALKVSDVVFRARGHLNDAVSPFRYSDADLLAYVNDAILEAKRHRPDFFVGKQSADPMITDGSSSFPLPDFTLSIVAVFVAGMCELRDDEHADTNRANALVSKYVSGLKTAVT